MTQGMVFASSNSSDKRHAHPVGGCLFVLLYSLFGVGCVALPEVEPPVKGDKRIVINKSSVKPSLLDPVEIDLHEPGVYFDVVSAIETTPSTLNTKIYWYYDFDSNLGLPIEHWHTCGGGERCFLAICNRPQPTADRHHLWVIVSDGDYKGNAKAPFEFEDSAVFDAVIWEIEPVNTCL
jgi:hypothetical protein